MSSPSKIRSGFNFISPFYDLFSKLFFGNGILNSQKYFLPGLGQFENVLIFGGGTGKILIECLENKTGTNYTYADISDKMIAKTKQRFEKCNYEKITVEFICGSYNDIPSEKKFDLIITPYVLDCFTEKELIIAMRSLSERLSENGKWLFTDFNIPEKGSMKMFSKVIVLTLYFFFNIFCGLGIKKLPPFEKHFQTLNFRIEKEKIFLRGILCAKIYSRQ